jgi:hypothetical protein
MNQFNIASSPYADAAKERLEVRFRLGQHQQDELVTKVANTHIRDKLVPPTKTHFFCEDVPRVAYGSEEEVQRADVEIPSIHPHALGQMCSVAGIARTYVSRLINGAEWEKALFVVNMNDLFHKGTYLDRSKQPTKFLHRLVGNELRGFLSRNFGRHLASMPLLRGFIHACDKVGARPIEASASSVRFSLKCYLPFVFEPTEGEFVSFGMTWSNSDFGSGRMKLALSTMRISSGATAVLDDVLSKVHIGSVIQDSDLEVSDETAAKEVEAQVSAIQDAVSKYLAPDSVNRLLDAIAAANEEQIPWSRLKSELGRLLQKGEIESIENLLRKGGEDIIDLPPPGRTATGEPIATRWWASNVVSWVASKETNPDRQVDLQELAGGFIKVKGEAA